MNLKPENYSSHEVIKALEKHIYYEKGKEIIQDGVRIPNKVIDDVIKVQSSSGNWDYEPYMHGLLNGMLLIESMVKNIKYEPYDAPKRWIKRKWYEKIIVKITGRDNPICVQETNDPTN